MFKKSYITVLVLMIVLGQSCTNSYPELVYENTYIDDAFGDSINRETANDVPIYCSLVEQMGSVNANGSQSSTRGIGPLENIFTTDPDASDGSKIKDRYFHSFFHVLAYNTVNPDFTQDMSHDLEDPNTCIVSLQEPAKLHGVLDEHLGKIARPAADSLKADHNDGIIVNNMDGLMAFLDEDSLALHLREKGLPEHATTMPARERESLPTTILYYPRPADSLRTVGYDFFAYYLDDAKILNSHRSHDAIKYDVRIDGTQDLMAGASPRLNQELLQKYVDKNYLRDDRATFMRDHGQKILSFDGGYSSYAARHSVNPWVNVHHLLTRLRFYITPVVKDGEDPEIFNRITIDSIGVRANTDATVTIATNDLAKVGTTADHRNLQQFFVLQDPDSTKLTYLGERYHVDMKDIEATKQLGSEMMLYPEQSYHITVYWHQTIPIYDGHTGEVIEERRYAETELDATLKDGTSFRAGYIHNVRMMIYGFQRIDIETSIGAWDNGGNIQWDPDNEYW